MSTYERLEDAHVEMDTGHPVEVSDGGTEFLDLIIQASEGIPTRIQHTPPKPMRGRAENLVDPIVWHDYEDEQEFLGIKLHGTITTCALAAIGLIDRRSGEPGRKLVLGGCDGVS